MSKKNVDSENLEETKTETKTEVKESSKLDKFKKLVDSIAKVNKAKSKK